MVTLGILATEVCLLHFLAALNAIVSVDLINCIQLPEESEIVEFAKFMQVLAVQIICLTRFPIIGMLLTKLSPNH